MKTNLILSVFMLSWALLAIQAVQDSNGKNAYIGSPGEPSCNTSGCHNTYNLNSGGGSVTMSSSNMSNNKYTPGTTYHITVKVSRQSTSLFGFGFEALDSAGSNAGNIVITSSSETTLHNTSYIYNMPHGRENIGHKKNAGATANNHSFTFDWKAPATYMGPVTFYAVGNAADNDGTASGDYIYTDSLVIQPAATPLITTINNISPFEATAGSTSATQRLYVSGLYLGGDITVNAPSGFNISLSAASGYSSSLTLTAASGRVPLTKIYIQYAPSSSGSNSGNINITSNSATTVNIPVSGTAYTSGSAAVYETGNLSTFSAPSGGSTLSQVFQVSGSNLTANLVVTAPNMFQVSTNASSGFASSVSLSPSSGTVNNTSIYIIFKPTSVGTQTGQVVISSTGATSVNVPVKGTGVNASTPNLFIYGTLPVFSTTQGTPTSALSLSVMAVGLNIFPLVITAPTQFEISTSSSSGFGKSITLNTTNGKVGLTAIFFRYNPSVNGDHYGMISFASVAISTVYMQISGYTPVSSSSLTITVSGNDTICKGQNTTLTANGANTYTWNPGGLTGSSINVSPTQTTTYTITGTTGSNTGNTTYTVTVNPLALASFSGTISGNTLSLSNSSANAAAYSWNFGDGGTSTQASPQHNYTQNGTYHVKLYVTNNCGTDSAAHDFTINAGLIIQVSGPDSICKGSQATLTASGANTYTWSPGNLTGSSINVSPTQTTAYTVTGTSGANTGNASITIQVKQLPIAAFNYSVAANGMTDFTSTSQNATNYIWFFDDGASLSGNAAPTHTYMSNGIYHVKMMAINNCGNDSSLQDITISGIANGVRNPNQDYTLYIYPNPASNILTLEGNLTNMKRITICEMTGREVYQQIFSGETDHKAILSLPIIPTGVYILRVHSGDSSDSHIIQVRQP